MKIAFDLKHTFPVTSSVLYHSWLDSVEHSKMTGGEANCSNQLGGNFTTWEGYILGENKALVNGEKIVQSWRTTNFDENDNDSEITLTFQDIESGCEMTLTHKNIPKGQPDYKQGWVDHYINPMNDYFRKVGN